MNYNKGSKNGRAILTEDKVAEIKEALKTISRGGAKRLAFQFNVTPATIYSIKNGYNWK